MSNRNEVKEVDRVTDASRDTDTGRTTDIGSVMDGIGKAAVAAAIALARTPADRKNTALAAAAVALRRNLSSILAANAQDMEHARAKQLSGALLDRLRLDERRVEAMAQGLEEIIKLPDPIGTVMAEWTRP